MLHGTSMLEVLTARAFTSDGVEGIRCRAECHRRREH